MIKVWKWDGREPNANSGAPVWIVEAYEKGRVLTTVDRKTEEKHLSVNSKYGTMQAKVGHFVFFMNDHDFLILDSEDYKMLAIFLA